MTNQHSRQRIKRDRSHLQLLSYRVRHHISNDVMRYKMTYLECEDLVMSYLEDRGVSPTTDDEMDNAMALATDIYAGTYQS